MFVALVLRAMARELTEKEIDRMSPRDRGVASRLDVEPDSPDLAAAEKTFSRKVAFQDNGFLETHCSKLLDPRSKWVKD